MVRRVIILFLGVLFWAGCGSSSFVGRRVDNFTAYYNTFYNARKSYESGYKAISQRDEAIDRNRYISLFVRPTGQTGNRDFDSAVLKSADVLRRHGDSKWVDDALLLIGKSYFYQENFVGALEKFREVIERQSALEDEARFWFARTLIISRSYDEALAFLQESIVRDGVSTKWKANFQLALGELYVQRQDWDDATEALTAGLKNSKDKEIAARAQFLLGQVSETKGQFAEASRAYRDVGRYSPLYELGFASELSAVRVEGLHGEAVSALKELRKMERDDKHFEYRDDLRLLRGRIVQKSGDADQAFNIYADLLYDENRTAPIKSELRGKVHYAIAELYRDLDGNYVLASAHFDTAAQFVVKPGAGIGVGSSAARQYAPEAITDAAELKESFGLFAKVYKNVAEMDSLLWLGSLTQEEFDAKILAYRQERAKILEQERKEREARLLEQQFRQSTGGQNSFSDRGLPPSKTNPLSQGELQRAGFLFHRDKVRSEEGRASFAVKWGDRPRVRNWRRLDAVRSQPSEEMAADEEASDGFDLDNPATLPEIDISGVPRDSLARAEMISKRAVARYELGNAFFLALEMPDSSAAWYRKVLQETGDEPVARRSYYALAEVQRALGDSVAAERLYDQILEQYPESEYAKKIFEQRGKVLEDTEPDSAAVAKEIYGLVYDEWRSGVQEGILDEMILLAAKYRGEEASAQALLAGAQAHLEMAGSDTLAVLAPLSVMLPDSILGRLWPEKLGKQDVFDAQPVPAIVKGDKAVQVELPDSTLVNPGETLAGPPGDSTAVSSPDPDDGRPIEPSRPDSLAAPGAPTGEGVPLAVEPDSTQTTLKDAGPDAIPDSTGVMHSADPDSLDLAREPSQPDSSTTQPAVHPDSLGTVSQTPDALAPIVRSLLDRTIVLYVEDLFDAVVRDFPRTPYAQRANDYLSVISDLRNPPVESLVDSLSMPADSMRALVEIAAVEEDSVLVTRLESTVDSLRTTGPIPIANLVPESAENEEPDNAAAQDSTVSANSLVQQTDKVTENLRVPPDSLRVVDEFGNPVKRNAASVEEPLGDESEVPPGLALPGIRAERVSEFPIVEVIPESFDETVEYPESSTLKPLDSNGKPDPGVVGWTVILERAADMNRARFLASQLEELADTTGHPVMILNEIDQKTARIPVTWGLFATQREAEEGVRLAGDKLPEGVSFLLLKPVEGQ